MSESSIESKNAYFGHALAGKYEPDYPKDDAFVDLEDILGDFMSYTISISSLATFAIEQLTLDAEQKDEALKLIDEQRDAMKKLAKTLSRVVNRAKEVGNGGN